MIWECEKCGILCICKCFKNAIDLMENAKWRLDFASDHDIGWLMAEKGLTEKEAIGLIEDLDYCGMACELCLDKESTHRFGFELETTTEFQRRYGAYIVRDAIELAANGQDDMSASELLLTAEDNLRELYGFRARGDVNTDNDRLFDIVKGLFPEEIVLRSHSPAWLSEGVLEVYLPDIGIAIEHRGADHYEVIDGDEEALNSKRKTDENIKRSCNENGVKMLVLPYFMELDRDTVGWRIAEARSRK